MIGLPLLLLGALLTLAAVFGARVSERGRGTILGFVLSPLHPGTWRATLAIVVGFWVELWFFFLISGLFSAGASTLLFGIGVVFLALAIETARLLARLERARAMRVDPRPLLPHPYRPYGHGLAELLQALFLDLSRWRDVLYAVIAFPLLLVEFVVIVLLWGGALALLSAPAWWQAAAVAPSLGAAGAGQTTLMAASLLVGLVLLPVAASVSQLLMALHRAVIAGLLCESEERVLARRVATLESSRRAVMDVEATELRRIERDLHDGAQQRLVMLAMDLGLAAEKIDADPARARELVLDAQGEARAALADIRDIVRRIAPAILLDRGLVAALGPLAGRSRVPTSVVSTLAEGERLPDSVERAAYFVVSEALTNVAKHAGGASRCEVRVRREGGDLVVEVWDDGPGGAAVEPGGGLAGLAGRVEALDGSLGVSSPDGGPTTVRARIPLGVAAPAWPPAPVEPVGWGGPPEA